MSSDGHFSRWLVPGAVAILAAALYGVLQRNVFGHAGNNALASLIVFCILFILVWFMRGSSIE